MTRVINRRDFIGITATAGAGLMVSKAIPAQSKNSSDELNIALIGAGTQGETLMTTCLKMSKDSGIRFRAVCDIWQDLTLERILRLLQRYGHQAKGYVDYRRMLEEEKDLDAVIIATPDFCHAEQTVACLRAGLNVYCEAPMSNTLEGARQMVKTAKQTGKILQIGYQRRSDPRYIHCQDKLINSSKLLGRITAVNAQWNQSARPDRGWSKRRQLDSATLAEYGYKSMHRFKNWMWYRDLGAGNAVDFGVHQIDVINWFLGANPKHITARGDTYFYDKKNHEWHDVARIIFDYETGQGPVSVCCQTVLTNGYGGNFEAFMGDMGTLELSQSPGRNAVYRDPDAPDWDKWVRLGFLHSSGMKEQKKDDSVIDVGQTRPPVKYTIPVVMEDPYCKPHLRNFFDAVRGKANLNCSAETACPATAAALKINEALAAGRTLAFVPEDFIA
ncbi:MAG: Gfo/Idh/MocA family oxidoreductase [Sedimentisphaerales bacterium]|nr:Gfo/Idh/MocA family oxidoreductase [Sedimentisphaerales bacterium]